MLSTKRRIPYKSVLMNLGITMTENIGWNAHISIVVRRVYAVIRESYSVSDYLPLHLRQISILSLAILHLLYGDVIFLNCKSQLMAKLERCFKVWHCTRFIHHIKRFDSAVLSPLILSL